VRLGLQPSIVLAVWSCILKRKVVYATSLLNAFLLLRLWVMLIDAICKKISALKQQACCISRRTLSA
jgi:hypothetical protein